MKKILATLLAVCLFIGTLPLAASAANSDFTIENGVLTKYNGPGGDVVIPDGVTSIGNQAFLYCESLTSITIPDGVTSIGICAFCGCESLTSITLPNSVTSIGDAAFSRCKSLTNITIPNSVTNIGESAFSVCTSLTDITIPFGVTVIGQSTFDSCKGLTNVTIPNSVTRIKAVAFNQCESLASVTIPDSVTEIGGGAFARCNGLTNVTIPRSVTAVGKGAFRNCANLTDVYFGGTRADFEWVAEKGAFPDSATIHFSETPIPTPGPADPTQVVASGDCSYYDGRNVKRSDVHWVLDREGTFTVYGKGAMYDYSYRLVYGSLITNLPWLNLRDSIKKVVIRDGVTTIGASAFIGCQNLRNVVIPQGVSTIGAGAFEDCDMLKDIIMPNSVTEIYECAFESCDSLTSVKVPHGVTRLRIRAFLNCDNLQEIYLPVSLRTIDGCAFYRSNNLKTVFYAGTQKQWSQINVDNRSAKEIGFSNLGGVEPGNKNLLEAVIHFNSMYPGGTPPKPTVGGFNDVYEGDYFADAVVWAVEKGITSGTGNGKFSPSAACTRGQIVTFLWNANGKPEPTSTVNPFVDVNSGDYYYKAVLWAKEKGITSGTDSTHFSPGSTCTRGQAMTFLWNSKGKPSASSTGGNFSDVKDGTYYTEAVRWAVGRGITSGTSATTFSPGDKCTRGQIVTFLYRGK